MSIEENKELLIRVFTAIEQRDDRQFAELLHPEFEIHWPPSLPYSMGKGRTWSDTWHPLQPTAKERRMDPRIVGANEDEVVVLWRQRGLTPSGERFEGDVLGLYKIRDGKLARAQMFYFDTTAVAAFLAKSVEQR
jgi:ketosteroid isomerase-like protein